MAKKSAPKTAVTKTSVPKAAQTRTAATTPKGSAKSADGKANAARPRAATKKEVYERLAEATGLARKDIAAVFAELTELIGRELGKKGPGVFAIPGLVKLQ